MAAGQGCRLGGVGPFGWPYLLLGHMSGDQFLATFLHASQPFDDRVFDFVEARFFDPDF